MTRNISRDFLRAARYLPAFQLSEESIDVVVDHPFADLSEEFSGNKRNWHATHGHQHGSERDTTRDASVVVDNSC